MRRLFEGTGLFGGFALTLWVIGLALFGSILISPHGWQWWMDVRSVQGHEQDGIVYYSVGGAHQTIADQNSDRSGPATVYFLASDPSDGSLHNTANQVIDWSATTGPVAVGTALMVAGLVKRRRRRLARADDPFFRTPRNWLDGVKESPRPR